MAAKTPDSAERFVPSSGSLKDLSRAAQKCEGCDLHKKATQTVFGAGPALARVILIGEQPGDQEDRAGKPFVGPAGQILDRALVDAGVDRSKVYITNAVKHFYFEERGKRRIHKKPRSIHISACRPWLAAEIAAIRPKVIVCLGGTAATALLGPSVRVLRDRGQWLESTWAEHLMLTIHPSALLRLPDPSMYEKEYKKFVSDLRMIVDVIKAVS